MTHARAKLLLLLAIGALLAPIVARGHVVFPHDNAREVGLGGATTGRSNRKFNDQSSVYVPAIHQHLQGDHRGWISTWNPHSQLGRPTFQLAGESKAFLPTHLLSLFTRDAFRLYTWQVVLAIVASAAFGYLLLQALGLSPPAALVGALALGCGFYPLYWTTFVLFLWSNAWTLALLWLCELQLRRPSAAKVLGLAVALQSLLLSGYPQTIVWNAWLGLAFLVWRLRVHRRAGVAALGGLAGLAAGLALGVAAALPVYLDVAENAARSARLDTGVGFFLQILPRFERAGDLATWFLQRFDPTWLGEPILESYPEPFNGLAATPLCFGLALLSLAAWRRTWGAWLFVAACVTMTLWPAAYAFGIRHLGLSLSRTIPLSAAFLPAAFLAARGLDAGRALGGRRRAAALALLGLATAAATAAALRTPLPLSPGFVAAGAVLWLVAIAFALRGEVAPVVAAALLATLHYGWRLELARPREAIHTSSALTRLVREAAGEHGRYAWVEGGFGLTLPSNQETLLDLASIHSYDSLSSKAYQEWAKRLSPEGARTYGRYFTHVSFPSVEEPDGRRRKLPELLDRVELARAGVRVVLSEAKGPLPASLATPLDGPGVTGGVYRATLEPLLAAQVPAATLPPASDGVRHLPRDFPREPLALERLEEHDDWLRLRVTPADEPTVVFLSRQHHPRWVAEAAGGTRLETLALDGFYQGVLVPPGTRELTLAFRPWVRLAWIPQALGVAWALGLALRALVRRRSAAAPA